MARFVRDYLDLLDARVAAIHEHLESGNDMTAHVVLLSLESSSSMVGARELAKLTGLLRGALERGQRSVMPGLLAAVTAAAAKVPDQLGSVS